MFADLPILSLTIWLPIIGGALVLPADAAQPGAGAALARLPPAHVPGGPAPVAPGEGCIDTARWRR